MTTNPAPIPDTSPPIPPTPKPGLRTSEGWVALLTLLLPAATLIFHQDFSGQVQAVAAAAAGITTAAYTISRALTKSAQVKASAAVSAVSTADAMTPSTGAPILTSAAAVDIAQIQAAAEQLATLLRNAQADQKAQAANTGHGSILALLS